MGAKVVPINLKIRMDERLKAALDAIPVAVAWTRLDDGHLEFMNRRFIDMFGYRPSEVGDVYELIRLTSANKEQAESTIAWLRGIIDHPPLSRVEYPTVEVDMISKDGARIIALLSGVALPEANMSVGTYIDITEARLREETLRRLSSEDPLTGLMNRRSIDLAVATRIALGECFELLMLDLDKFKQVNDQAGHSAGDAVLTHFAEVLRSCFRREDIIARWGGDEFAVLLPGIDHEGVAALVARVEDALKEPALIDGSPFLVRFSAGWAIYPSGADTIQTLYKAADEAMYHSKREKLKER